MKSQNNSDSTNYDLEVLREQWRDLTYRIAVTEYAQQEADRLMEQIAADEANGNTQADDLHFAQAEQKTLRVIRNADRKQKFSTFARQTLPTIGKVAASILLTLFIGLSAAVAGVHSVRVRVLELLINIEEEYTELSLQENTNASFDAPSQWGGSYYPSKIPSGFVISQIQNIVQNCFVSFTLENDTSTEITFLEQGEDTYANLDTEDAVISSRMVKDSPALLVTKGNTTSVAWAADNLYFVLICHGLQENDVLSIANSVVRIK